MIVLQEEFFTDKRLLRDMQLLDEAIARWTVIRDEDNPPASTCSLCSVYSANTSEVRCGECPVFVLTGKKHCFGTPFYDTGRLGDKGVAEVFVPLLQLFKLRWRELFHRRRLEKEEVWSLFARVVRALERAEENGYSMELMCVDNIADDLMEYDVDFERENVRAVLACVERWKNGERLCP